MWPSTALRVLDVFVILTAMTTVASELGTGEVPGDIGHSTNEKTDEKYGPTGFSTIETDFEEYFKVQDSSSEKSMSDEFILSTLSPGTDSVIDNSATDAGATKLSLDLITRDFDHQEYSGLSRDQQNEILAGDPSDLDSENRGFSEPANNSGVSFSVLEVNTEWTASPSLDTVLLPENVRAISFQIPGSRGTNERNPAGGERKSVSDFGTEIKKPLADSEEIGRTSGSKGSYSKIVFEGINPKGKSGDHSGQQKNQIIPKSAKAFYEIKSSMTTEAVIDSDNFHDPSTHANPRKFTFPTIPWMASAMGKYGPYFEDGPGDTNITARIGSTVLLDCKIGMLHDKTVTWVQHIKDSIHLLTVARQVYSADQRVSLSFRYPSNWRLQIQYASLRDSGLYECQVATHPPRIKKINLIVTAPVLTIVDDAGRVVAAGERHLKAGSVLKLSCEARDVREDEGESLVWTRGDETLTENVSENKTMEYIGEMEIHVVVSTVSVDKATPRHAGNYSCSVPGRTKSTVVVHVLNGELPAAVHDGNGVSHAVLNLWLVHLTISYVFSR
ncbi:uncharacterized protein LOC124186212 isoform X1 [Neodiprion fabricii]|uniref:uncharacterized protein LOC124186212 isoform X1 n=1 Tax=Neodiprion fabricii TaxID=2872261 RepID=UPI001ED91C6F|nr:uncharacterized protein LOC124186212 isoform X1 [Neodiprion fabricii]XP_046433670.1 uncharacterized protein LOC124186212 isoform X1 [Neodiprion fabricii]XP_046433671.1 uncharacterized protein LOC124186212 isoform X1 [Neodiprion fabricii]XP_046433672.1 uncharacterized protein LOC124186212 isoform X1 [Neodiprion fabricii]XP_046433673.1 uncharacterized protein LOC124186212 isoform X1 [Neodiprion fabricii]XP_046433674.1 uncharacterized protein LOC124186212 isoform X1 [Neodiprion fabricii]XP_04